MLRKSRGAAMEFIEPISWPVDEFLLIASAQGEGRHTVLARFPLSQAPPPG